MADDSAAAFYDAADWYDFLHAPETEAELPVILSIFGALGNGSRRVLEPACGTGRYLAALAKRGFDCLGYDLNPRTLSFAKRRLKGTSARVLRADMKSFRLPVRLSPENGELSAVDLALCLIGSFRHLLSDSHA